MNRTGLAIALGIAAIVGLIFAFDPQLDLTLSAPFHDPQWPGGWLAIGKGAQRLRLLASWIVTLVAAPAFLALAWKLIMPRRRMLMPARGAVLMIVTLTLGPGLLTNVVLKDHWGRPRPIDVIEFKGNELFVPWWNPRGDCPNNCS